MLENIQLVCFDDRQIFDSYPVHFIICRSPESHLTITNAMCSFPVYTLVLQIRSMIVEKKKKSSVNAALESQISIVIFCPSY